MSEYVAIQTQLRDPEALVGALQDLGFEAEAIERHAEAVTLYDFCGRARAERAEIVVRRQHVGFLSNDLGFRRRPDGTWQAIVSEYDQAHAGRHGPYDGAWLGRLKQAYAVRALSRQYQALGWRVRVERHQDGAVHLTAER